MSKLKKINLKPVYLIYGEDNYLIDNYIEEFLKKIPDSHTVYLDDGEEDFLKKLNKSITTIPLMSNKRVIISNCNKYFTAAQKNDKLLRKILNKLNDQVVLLIIVKGKINKRLGVVNDIKKAGKLINLKPPRYKQLDKWIRERFKEQGKTIDSKSLKLLEHLFNNQLQRLDSEIEKICVYNINKKNLNYNDIKDVVSKDRMLADNVIFSFVDALCMRQKKKALILLKEMLKDGEVPLRILANIVWQMKLLIQVKELKEKGNNIKGIAKTLKQHPYPVEKAFKKCENFTEEELEIILEKLLQANVDIVSGKYNNPKISLEMMIHQII